MQDQETRRNGCPAFITSKSLDGTYVMQHCGIYPEGVCLAQIRRAERCATNALRVNKAPLTLTGNNSFLSHIAISTLLMLQFTL